MNLGNAMSRAKSVTTERQAAALYNDINFELSLGDPDPAQEQNGEQAQAILRDRFGADIAHKANDVTKPPRTSRKASDTLAGGSRRRGTIHKSGGARSRARSTKRPGTADARGGRTQSAPPASPSPGRRERVRSAAGTAARTTASGAAAAYQAADETAGGLIGYVILGGVALSLVYLFLTRAAAAGKLFQGLSTAVRAVVSPTVDPLNPKGALL